MFSKELQLVPLWATEIIAMKQESLFVELCWHHFYSEKPKKGAGGLISPPKCDLVLRTPRNGRTRANVLPHLPFVGRQDKHPLQSWSGLDERVLTGLQPLSQPHIWQIWVFIVASWLNSAPTDSQVNPDFRWQYRIKNSVWCHMQRTPPGLRPEWRN